MSFDTTIITILFWNPAFFMKGSILFLGSTYFSSYKSNGLCVIICLTYMPENDFISFSLLYGYRILGVSPFVICHLIPECTVVDEMSAADLINLFLSYA